MSQTVQRAIELVEFCGQTPRTLTEAAEHLGVHKSTALRLLQTLEAGGFTRVVKGRYTTGFRLIAIANQALNAIDLRTIARPHITGLADEFGHTIHLTEYQSGGKIIYLDKVEGPGALKMLSQIGLPAVLHTSGVAKAILAHLDGPDRVTLLKQATFERYTPDTLTTPDALNKDLEETRRRGWAEDNGELETFVNCVAAPIFDFNGAPIGSISISALKVLAPMGRLREMTPTLLSATRAISEEFGWREDRP